MRPGEIRCRQQECACSSFDDQDPGSGHRPSVERRGPKTDRRYRIRSKYRDVVVCRNVACRIRVI